MSKADCIAAKALTYVGMRYGLGEEGKYVVGPQQTTILDIDCSGLLYALCRDCGVLYKGKPLWRDTADGYWHLATKLAGPERIGDCCWFPRVGHKTHIAIYIGDGRTIEAGYHGPNNKYPGAHYVGTCTIAQMNARGAIWGRIEGLDIYDETEDDMNEAEVRAIVREEIEQVWDEDAGKAADAHLTKLGIINKAHPAGKAVSVRYLNITLSRVLKKLGL